jgi:hypothetical protein
LNNQIADQTLQQWQQNRRVRRSISGWISGNAVCCQHRGHNVDTRGRGGLMLDASTGSVVWHCFNCNFSTIYTPGQHLNYKFRKLLSWMGMGENEIRWLVIEAIRIKDTSITVDLKEQQQTTQFSPTKYALPEDAVNVLESLDTCALEYLLKRNISPYEYDFYTSNLSENNLNRRVIAPCTWKNDIIGYSARAWDTAVAKKYHAQYDKSYVFNIDRQQPDWKFVLVNEGPFDAMSVHGVSVLSNECNLSQVDLIDSLAREVIVVPDFDVAYKNKRKIWAGANLIDQALEYGWSVSFPIWAETCKDANEAVVKYGRLFVIKSIIEAKEHSKLKIEIKKRAWYNNI